jgi:hypothetical protein
MRTLRYSLLTAITLSLGYAGFHGASFLLQSGESPDAPVVIINHHRATVAVYAVNNGTIYRLGSVEAANTRTFQLSKSALENGELGIRVRPLGQLVDHSSGPIRLEPGETIEMTVDNLLELSSVQVY